MTRIRLWRAVALSLAVMGMAQAHSDPIALQDIDVVDGDTIAVNGNIVHLVDFETPRARTGPIYPALTHSLVDCSLCKLFNFQLGVSALCVFERAVHHQDDGNP